MLKAIVREAVDCVHRARNPDNTGSILPFMSYVLSKTAQGAYTFMRPKDQAAVGLFANRKGLRLIPPTPHSPAHVV